MTAPKRPKQLRMTAATMQQVVRSLRAALPMEGCGYAVAGPEAPDVATSVRMMKNIHEEPDRFYQMDDEEIIAAYREFDETGQEPLAAFHAHPSRAAVMSAEDLRKALDESLAYVVVSFLDAKPVMRAYSVRKFVGTTQALEIPIMQAPVPQPVLTMPSVPWALTPGNRVRIGFVRHGKKDTSICVANVLACNEFETALEQDNKTNPGLIPLERIRSVHVITEGEQGKDVRGMMRLYARRLNSVLAGSDLIAMPQLVEGLRKGYPLDIVVTMDEPQ